jgi:type III secretion system FlhB-like substrate exporter
LIKTVIKLLITVAILNAVFRAGVAALDYYQLRDEAQQLIVFGGGIPTGDLHNRILQKAAELEVPLQSKGLVVRRDGVRTIVEAS